MAKTTEAQKAHEAAELAVAQANADNLSLRRERKDQLEAFKNSLDNTLANFENTSDNTNLNAARETIDGVRDRLNALRAEVTDAINDLE